MVEKRYQLVFSGKLVENRKPADVLAKLSDVLKLGPQEVRDLFKTGNGAVILDDLKGTAAYAMQEQLREAGAICSVKEMPAPIQEPLSGCMLSGETANPYRPARQQQTPATQSRMQPSPLPQSAPGTVSTIVKLCLLIGVAAGGWWGYQTYLAPPSPAYQVYNQFAEAMLQGQYQKAEELASGDAREYAASWIKMTAPTSMKIYGKEFNMSPPSVSSIAGDISWVKRKRKSEKKSADNSKIVLEVEETVCRIPPGVSSALCKWPVTFRHEAELQLLDGTWKVAGFKAERLTPMQ